MQGGGYTSGMVAKTPLYAPIKLESNNNLSNLRGTIAMAKSQQPNSAGSQFFLVYEDSNLPPEYSVVGNIGEEGLKTLDKIADEGTKSDDPQNPDSEVPKKEVKIEKAVVTDEEEVPTPPEKPELSEDAQMAEAPA